MRLRNIVLPLLAASILLLPACKKNTAAEDTTADTTEEEITTELPDAAQPEYTHPLTGLACEKDLSGARPISIMINNIKASLPQEGVAQADILYECLAEGGITRLMGIITDYSDLTQIGSVRSARDYYIDYANGYDCIFFHAGGSDYAYNTLAARNTDHVDGVQGPSYLYTGTGTFIRDPQRLKTYSSEHTLMIQNGAGIQAAIEYYDYRTQVREENASPMQFAAWGETVTLEQPATEIFVTMSTIQNVKYTYDAAAGVYLRYQYDGMPHMDSTTGKQLAFTNVLLISAECGGITGDEKGRIWMETTGSSNGWYITGGTCAPITWKKESHDSVMRYYYADGTEVAFNRGKTMINVVPSYNMDTITFQ